MKAVTEFASFTLNQGIKSKAALTTEGKTPEEVQATLGETFKLEGEKLTYFVNAVDVAAKNPESLKRVVVMSLNEGENAPAKGIQIEQLYYVPEFYVEAKPAAQAQKPGGKGGRPNSRDRAGGTKTSPWGLTPEEKAAKSGGKAKAAKPS